MFVSHPGTLDQTGGTGFERNLTGSPRGRIGLWRAACAKSTVAPFRLVRFSWLAGQVGYHPGVSDRHEPLPRTRQRFARWSRRNRAPVRTGAIRARETGCAVSVLQSPTAPFVTGTIIKSIQIWTPASASIAGAMYKEQPDDPSRRALQPAPAIVRGHHQRRSRRNGGAICRTSCLPTGRLAARPPRRATTPTPLPVFGAVFTRHPDRTCHGCQRSPLRQSPRLASRSPPGCATWMRTGRPSPNPASVAMVSSWYWPH